MLHLTIITLFLTSVYANSNLSLLGIINGSILLPCGSDYNNGFVSWNFNNTELINATDTLHINVTNKSSGLYTCTYNTSNVTVTLYTVTYETLQGNDNYTGIPYLSPYNTTNVLKDKTVHTVPISFNSNLTDLCKGILRESVYANTTETQIVTNASSTVPNITKFYLCETNDTIYVFIIQPFTTSTPHPTTKSLNTIPLTELTTANTSLNITNSSPTQTKNNISNTPIPFTLNNTVTGNYTSAGNSISLTVMVLFISLLFNFII